MRNYFFYLSALSFLAGSGTIIPDPQHCIKYLLFKGKYSKIGSLGTLSAQRVPLRYRLVRYCSVLRSQDFYIMEQNSAPGSCSKILLQSSLGSGQCFRSDPYLMAFWIRIHDPDPGLININNFKNYPPT